jgi:hypothetical protein
VGGLVAGVGPAVGEEVDWRSGDGHFGGIGREVKEAGELNEV